MTMNRRQFLKNMGIGAAGAALPGVSMFAANEAMNPQDKSLFKLPELHCDVIVVGAGPAGIPAAVAAAREGAKVILLEEDMMPGGAPVDMYVTYMCGAPRVGVFIDMVRELNQKHSLSITPSSTFGQWALVVAVVIRASRLRHYESGKEHHVDVRFAGCGCSGRDKRQQKQSDRRLRDASGYVAESLRSGYHRRHRYRTTGSQSRL